MKRAIKLCSIIFCASILFTSCHSYTTVVGKGAQGNNRVKNWNNYLIGGLIPVGVSDSKQMAAGAENYTVKTEMSFINGLISTLTWGIYSPTTTTVTK